MTSGRWDPARYNAAMIDNPSDNIIRRATPDDAANLAALGAATFTETFGHLYPSEDLHTFLSESHSVNAWAHALANARRAVWIATLVDTTPVGFIVAGACKLPVENREPAAGEIQQLYVLARHHNLRLGSRLMDIGLEWLAAQGRTPVYVGVWSENFGAQRFYGRYGFHKVGEYGFPVGKTVDREFILKR
jgi:ribosomal protein S18 acetylase RimI-like enzyme